MDADMPAVSKKQRQMMAIAEHHPGKLYKRNRSVLNMSHEQLHEFASAQFMRNGPGRKRRRK